MPYFIFVLMRNKEFEFEFEFELLSRTAKVNEKLQRNFNHEKPLNWIGNIFSLSCFVLFAKNFDEKETFLFMQNLLIWKIFKKKKKTEKFQVYLVNRKYER
jgi:hypothetical protein